MIGQVAQSAPDYSSGNHEGFSNSKNQVGDFLKKYIKDKNIKGKTKIWIVGFSRGAAVANMLAGEITARKITFDNVNFGRKDIYAYTE